MKSTVALLIPVLGALGAVAQTKEPFAPIIKKMDSTAYTGYCRHMAAVKVDLTTDALTLGLTEFWPNSKDLPPRTDRIPTGEWVGYCGFMMTLVPQSPGYRFRFKDAVFTGSAKITGKSSVSRMQTSVWQDYVWYGKNWTNMTPGVARPGKIARSFGGMPVTYELSDIAEMAYGKEFDSTFSYTAQPSPNPIDYWSPCTGSDYDEYKDEFIVTFVHMVYASDWRDEGANAEVGKPNGKSDIVVRLNIEWEACDAVKADFRNTWHNLTMSS